LTDEELARASSEMEIRELLTITMIIQVTTFLLIGWLSAGAFGRSRTQRFGEESIRKFDWRLLMNILFPQPEPRC